MANPKEADIEARMANPKFVGVDWRHTAGCGCPLDGKPLELYCTECDMRVRNCYGDCPCLLCADPSLVKDSLAECLIGSLYAQ